MFDDPSGYNIIYVTKIDQVYGVGSNAFGLLGLGNDKPIRNPQIIPELCNKNISQFIIETRYILALNKISNEIYVWGSVRTPGNSDTEKLERSFRKPDIMEYFSHINVTKIACGNDHLLVLNDQGEVYAWGNNTFGQVGSGNQDEYIYETILLEIPDKIRDIYSWEQSSFAITYDGQVYSWGKNHYDNLGLNIPETIIYEPRLIPHLCNIKSIRSTGLTTHF